MKRALMVLMVAWVLTAVGPSVLAQAIAESAVIHANSTATAGVAKALGGHIEGSFSKVDSQFAYPPRTHRSARRVRAHPSKSRPTASQSSIAISSIVGGACAPNAPSPQAKPAAGSTPGNCAVTHVPVASAKSNPSEITVSF